MYTIFNKLQTALILGHLPCPVHSLTGFYCPGCGGTRAFLSLIHGHVIVSFIQNPMTIYIIAAFIINIGQYAFAKKKGLHNAYAFNTAWLWVALVLMIINCIIKNIALYNGFDIIIWANSLG